jgi:muconolactone delta-isomerase
MEYLVTMTTHVPDGTPKSDVDDVVAREAAHSRELAAEGLLLRLWRPPLQPGEWRSLGLFTADDDGQLARTLASMPLHVWRSDQVTALAHHPNDPGPGDGHDVRPEAAEFLTTFTIRVPADASTQAVADAEAGEAARAHELADEGRLERLWVLPGQGHALGLWRATDGTEMRGIVDSLPLGPWMATDITPLTPHPSDPAKAAWLSREEP